MYKKTILPFAILMLLASCTQSQLSNKFIVDLTVIKANIEIHQPILDVKSCDITIQLTDKYGNEIGHDAIKIFVNNKKLNLETLEQHGSSGLSYLVSKKSYQYTQSVHWADLTKETSKIKTGDTTLKVSPIIVGDAGVIIKGDTLNFDMELPNGKRFFLAEIPTLSSENEAIIKCGDEDRNRNWDKDVMITWKNLKDANYLIVSKTYL